MGKITPFLWFDNNAEEAMKFYTSVFKKGSKITGLTRYSDTGPGPKGSVMTGTFTLQGQEFIALNGGPMFKFNESISFTVSCKTQKEVDYYWEKLSSGGGEKSQCGWLKDKFGLSWQVVPEVMGDLMSGNAEKTGRVMKAMMKMTRLDIAALKKAAKK